VPSHVGASPNESIDSSRAARSLRRRVAFALLGSTCVSLQRGVSVATLAATCAALMLGANAAPAAVVAPSLEQPGGGAATQIGSWAGGVEQPQDPLSKITFPNLPG